MCNRDRGKNAIPKTHHQTVPSRWDGDNLRCHRVALDIYIVRGSYHLAPRHYIKNEGFVRETE